MCRVYMHMFCRRLQEKRWHGVHGLCVNVFQQNKSTMAGLEGVCVCVCVRACVCVCVRVRAYVCVCTCVYACIHMCIYIYYVCIWSNEQNLCCIWIQCLCLICRLFWRSRNTRRYVRRRCLPQWRCCVGWVSLDGTERPRNWGKFTF